MAESSAKQQFIKIYTDFIKRDGASSLLDYLNRTDFFTAPASARFHMAEVGGLCQHSLNVYNRLLAAVKADFGDDYQKVYSDETLAICGLLHDLCKVNYYVVEMRNVKEESGWVKRPFFKVEEKFPYGHGEKSVFIATQYIKLTPEEAMAINWHMGGFDDTAKAGSFAIAHAYEQYPLAVKVHLSDLEATYLCESRNEDD